MDVNWIESLIKLGSIAGALTGVGKILIGIYNKTVVEPQNKLMQRIQEENSKQIVSSLNPLTISIDRLNHLLEDSQKDREVLHKKTEKNSKRIDNNDIKIENHEGRILVLEDRCSVRKGR